MNLLAVAVFSLLACLLGGAGVILAGEGNNVSISRLARKVCNRLSIVCCLLALLAIWAAIYAMGAGDGAPV